MYRLTALGVVAIGGVVSLGCNASGESAVARTSLPLSIHAFVLNDEDPDGDGTPSGTVILTGGPPAGSGGAPPRPVVEPEFYSLCGFTRISGYFDEESYLYIDASPTTGFWELRGQKSASNPHPLEADVECALYSEFAGLPDPEMAVAYHLSQTLLLGEYYDIKKRDPIATCPWAGWEGELHPVPGAGNDNRMVIASFDTGDIAPYEGPNFEDVDSALMLNIGPNVTTDLTNHANCAHFQYGDWREPEALNEWLVSVGPFFDGEWVPATPGEYWCFIGGILEGSEVCTNPAGGCAPGVEVLEVRPEMGGPIDGGMQYRVHISPAEDDDGSRASQLYVQCLAWDQSGGF